MEEDMKEERLDSPLVVHKKSDASYQENAVEITMSATHTDDEGADVPTLERHRFKKKKKNKKTPYIILALIAVAAVVICVLIYSGIIPVGHKETTAQTTKSYTETQENKFKDVITVKGTYIFFEGRELDGLGELEREIKYLDEGTKFTIQDENADSNFLNFDVLSLLSRYSIHYDITHVVSSGLVSKYEQKQSETASHKPSASEKSVSKTSKTKQEKN